MYLGRQICHVFVSLVSLRNTKDGLDIFLMRDKKLDWVGSLSVSSYTLSLGTKCSAHERWIPSNTGGQLFTLSWDAKGRKSYLIRLPDMPLHSMNQTKSSPLLPLHIWQVKDCKNGQSKLILILILTLGHRHTTDGGLYCAPRIPRLSARTSADSVVLRRTPHGLTDK